MATSTLNEDAPTDSARRRKTRERLLDAALDVFAEYGVHPASVEMIADAAGFTRGAFYSNFSSKNELFFALMARNKATRLQQLNEGVAAQLHPVAGATRDLDDDGVVEVIARVLELQTDDHRWWLLHSEFMLLAMRDPAIAGAFLEYEDTFQRELTTIIVEALASVSRRFIIAPEIAVRMITEFCTNDEAVAMLRGDTRTQSARLSSSVSAIVLAFTQKV